MTFPSAHIFGCFLRNPFYGRCVQWWIKQGNGHSSGEIQGVIFLWKRGAWTIQLIFGHSHIWSGTKPELELAKKKYRKTLVLSEVILNKWIFQIILCQPPLLCQMSSKADAKIHLTDETYEWQHGNQISQNGQTYHEAKKHLVWFQISDRQGWHRYSN